MSKSLKKYAIISGSAIFIIGILYYLINATPDKHFDFMSFFQAAEFLVENENPYTGTYSLGHYIYPLTFAWFLTPTVFFGPDFAFWLFTAISVFAIFHSFYLFIHFFSREQRETVFLIAIWVGNLQIFMFGFNIIFGQTNIVILWFCLLFIHYILKEKDAIAALFLSLAIVIKLVPAILIIWLVLRKKRRALMLTIIFIIIFLLLPGVTEGPVIFEYYNTYLHVFIFDKMSISNDDRYFFTLIGLLRKFTDADINLILNLSLLFAPLGLVALIQLRQIMAGSSISNSSRDNEDDLFVLNLYTLLFVITSPMSESPHLVWTFFTMVYLLHKTYLMYQNDRNIVLKLYFTFTLIGTILIRFGNITGNSWFYFIGLFDLYVIFIVIWLKCGKLKNRKNVDSLLRSTHLKK